MPPVVYCETNWIVALAFPHHQLHRAATKLHAEARSGTCRLCLPVAALLEARGPLNEVSAQVSRTFALLRDDLFRAVQNGCTNLGTLSATFQASKEVDAYAQRDAFATLESLRADSSVTLLDDVPASIAVLHELRPKVRLQGKDVVDLYLLAAVLQARRKTDLAEPTIFFSANKREFGPSNKVPPEVYDADKVLWREDFDLSSAVGAWKAKFPPPP